VFDRARRAWPLLAAFLLLLGMAPAAHAAKRAHKAQQDREVHMNQIQVMATHDSYHRELSAPERAMVDSIVGRVGAYDGSFGYSHLTLGRQLAKQNVRGLELDIWPDPQGGLYANPLVRQRLNMGPLPDPAWRQPGLKVMHVADEDYATTCVLFTECLRQVKTWSDANPNHVPLYIMLELKSSSRTWVDMGGAQSPAWDATQMDEIDREIRSVFKKKALVTPDDVRKPGLTVNQSIRQYGWPTLDEARGKVMFHFNNVPNLSPYTDGHPNLENRLLFPNANPGEANSAYRGRDEILDLFPEIQDLVRSNYLVRTRSDISLSTVRSGDMTPVQRALDSGAQMVSTDFPTEGMSARYGTDFVSQLPGGVAARCNPVNAPAKCRDDGLEDPKKHKK
jgi:hypothetical protein